MMAVLRSHSAWRSALWSLLAVASTLVAHSPVVAADAIQAQDSNIDGVVAEVVECKRQDGTLTVKIRFRNTSEKKISFRAIEGRNYDSYYLTVSNKKFFVLRDTEKTPLATPADGSGYAGASLDKNAAYTFWAKYPAPPADAKLVNIFTPLTPPFDNVPISD